MKEVINLKKEAFQTWLWPWLLWKKKHRCARNSGTILVEWWTGLGVPIFKKGDQSAPVIGVLLYSASPEKVTPWCWKGG